ncbi:GNAT family N-acetyltransferase [Streptomyces sp. I05A-00742]|uniref:GNAT family N-acetyltransferase n=1 Tax=Streptomyces sp. I05A-00742 TaxID=2732853 RepID=UPI001BB13D56|nr:GNAT family N-acetyltransferase [Streptomyces sp. I05A-00742]
MPSLTSLSLRPYEPTDRTPLLALIDADRLPGQPRATAAMLVRAMQGSAAQEDPWWGEYGPPSVQVAVDAGGALVGAVSCARRAEDDAGLIQWLHCREDAAVAEGLIAHALTALPPRPVEAFQFATALTQGLEALPVRHRPVTRAALERAGFAGERLWRYMRAELPRPELPRAVGLDIVDDTERRAARRLRVRREGRTVAEAVVGPPVQGIGVLWWIEVCAEARGRGLGRAVLGSALAALGDLGADQVVLYVDDDEPPGGERDRTAANALYQSAGFTEVDHLWSYSLHRGAATPGRTRSVAPAPAAPRPGA